MYIATDQGQTNPGDNILMSTETSCHFGQLLQVSNKISLKSDFIHFCHDFSPGQGLTTPSGRIEPQVRGRQPQGTTFCCQQKPVVISVICYKFQIKSFWSLILYIFIMILVPGQGLTTRSGRNFDVNRNILSLRSFVASFKKSH